VTTPPTTPDQKLAQLERGLERAMLAERVRLGKQLEQLRQALEKGRPPKRLLADLEHISKQLHRSQRTRRQREQALDAVTISYPEELPISARVDDIRRAIEQNPVVVIAGDTGSGKTTQIPKMCLQAGRARGARIAVTQPRRVAALSLSRRLAEELDVEWGRQVGAKIRFRDQTAPETLVKFVTDGMLLAEIRSDRDLLEYDTLIVDEAHERSLNIDFLLGYLRTLRRRRPDLKIIITSATIDTESFSKAFDDAPIIEVSGRMFPVETRHWSLEELFEDDDGDLSYTDGAVTAVQRLLDEPGSGDVLVFMPSERDIRETRDLLADRLGSTQRSQPIEILPLFSRLSSAEQHRVFGGHSGRRVVIATNIAETSLTIPGIRYVVDTGLARVSRYNPRTQTQRLPIEAISQSSAEQRKGRCGRVAEGICVRIFSEEDFLSRPEYTQPEIQRANLAEVILRMLDLEFGSVETFPFIDPPQPAAIRGGYQVLEELGAIDHQRKLTRLGAGMAHLPIAPTVSRMILQAHAEGALPEVLIIAAAISVQDPRERPTDKQAEADAQHKRFIDPRSDFVSLFNIWQAYHDQLETATQSQMRRFCREHFLSFMRMREWRDIHAQLEGALRERGGFRLDVSCLGRDAQTAPNPQRDPEGQRRRRTRGSKSAPAPETQPPGVGPEAYDAIHRCILTGLFSNVALKKAEPKAHNLYNAARGRQVMIFPGSGLFNRPGRQKETAGAPKSDARQKRTRNPTWIIAAEMVETNRLYARTAAAIEPAWIEQLGQYLCRISHRDPHWSRKDSRVLAHETVRLHGLVIANRRIGYSRIAPREATDIFIREALIAADVDGIVQPFYEHNRQLLRRLEAWQARQRQRHAIDLDNAYHDFYAERLPEGVGSVADLNRVIKEQGSDGFLHAEESQLLGGHELDLDEDAFPAAVDLENGERLPITYAYAPGQDEDGITVRIPYRLIDAVRADVLEWLVPGLREEKTTCLLRSLPKALRKRFVPIPDTARRIAPKLRPADGSFLNALENCLQEEYGIAVRRGDWDPAQIPTHLQMRVEVEGTEGETIVAGRNLATLTGQLERPAEAPVQAGDAWQKAVSAWEQDDVTHWSFTDLPERLEVTQMSGIPVFGFPGLQLDGASVHVRIFAQRGQAEQSTPDALVRLCEFAMPEEIAWLQREMRDLRKIVTSHRSLGEPAELERQAYKSLSRYLFLAPPLLPLTKQRYEARVQTAKDRLQGLSERVLDELEEIVDWRGQIIAITQPYPELKADLLRLLPPGFLATTDVERLPDLVRYLKAVHVRADRYRADRSRDRTKIRQVESFDARLTTLVATWDEAGPAQRQQIDAYRWLLEEFRVSIFAQELGTAQKVSVKRLETQLEAVEKAGP
jgi:ATP-dependent helicase HrpA